MFLCGIVTMNSSTMRPNSLNLICFLLGTLLLFSCKRTIEDFQTNQIADYVPLEKGKYITYQVDSTVFTNFGRSTEIHSYQEKNLIDTQLVDGMGRTGYRIFRFLRDSAGTGPWSPAGSYFVTPLDKTIELTENNLRFVKLSLPIVQGFTWKGNQFLPNEPYSTFYSFNNDFDIATWDNTYSSIGETINLNGNTVNDVITVEGIDDVFNVPVIDSKVYGAINRFQEKYAKGIGMVYQELTMWEYQPNTSGQGGGFKIGFGVIRSMIDHN